MKLVKEHIIFEKFTSDSDPIEDLGIGIFIKRNFNSYEELNKFILKNLQYILNTKKIPKDIINDRDYVIRNNYYLKICDYIDKYISIKGEKLEGSRHNWWPDYVRDGLIKKGFKIADVNEKFTADSDPVRDMGIGSTKLIKDWLNKHEIRNYTINDNLTINVLDLYLKDLKENLPDYIRFNEAKGSVNIIDCKFTTLKGCPPIVGGYFTCQRTNIKNLIGGPLQIMTSSNVNNYGYYLYGNKSLTSLKGIPLRIKNFLVCSENTKLSSIEHFPEHIKGDLVFEHNGIVVSEEEIRKKCKITGKILFVTEK